ncbi:cohesin domain-containing protein, partial [Candidatus Omnitrophota bacterium]
MRKALLVLGLLGVLSISSVASALTVDVADASGRPGNTGIPVRIRVSDIGTADIIGIDLRLNYDRNLLNATEVRAGSLVSGWTMQTNLGTAGQVRIALYGTTALGGSGDIVEVRFDVPASAGGGNTSALTLAQADFNEVRADRINNGEFDVTGSNYNLNIAASNGSVARSPNSSSYASG